MTRLVLWAGIAAAGIAEAQTVKVRNEITHCVSIEKQQIVTDGSITKLVANATFLQSTGVCGCTSALLEYRVSTGADEKEVEWVRAVVSARPHSAGTRKRFEFVLSGDSGLPVGNEVTLRLQCAPHK